MLSARFDDPRRWGSPLPGPEEPIRPPGVGADAGSLSPWLEQRLFDQRIVVFHGPLSTEAATRTAAALLALDALGPEPVRLHLSCAAGDLTAAFALVDAIDAMRAPVHVLVTAQAVGAAVAVLAAAQRRLAYRHARIRLCEPPAAPAVGTADQVATAAGHYLRQVEELAERVAAVTGRPRSRIEHDLTEGRDLTATEAREYGLIDEIVGEPGERGA